MKRQLFIVMMLLVGLVASAQEYKTVTDINFTAKSDAYAQERLKLDVYYPEGAKDCPVIVWFHGGGIEAGQKEIPEKLKNKGYVVIPSCQRVWWRSEEDCSNRAFCRWLSGYASLLEQSLVESI